MNIRLLPAARVCSLAHLPLPQGPAWSRPSEAERPIQGAVPTAAVCVCWTDPRHHVSPGEELEEALRPAGGPGAGRGRRGPASGPCLPGRGKANASSEEDGQDADGGAAGLCPLLPAHQCPQCPQEVRARGEGLGVGRGGGVRGRSSLCFGERPGFLHYYYYYYFSIIISP